MAIDPHWIDGFSKLSKADKRTWLSSTYGTDPNELLLRWQGFDSADPEVQDRLDNFAENTIANYPLPLGIAPNFLIDGAFYAVPMVIEESSVVAAASAAAKYWSTRGGFKTTILGTTKIGQLFFEWEGDESDLRQNLPKLAVLLKDASHELTVNMESRGGGILDISLESFPELPNTYELRGKFETCDSMGANFINSVLEAWGTTLPSAFAKTGLNPSFASEEQFEPVVIMAILSNYTPECVVRAEVSCPIAELGKGAGGFSSAELAIRFHRAIQLARVSPYRATTHNKGIFNGIDAVVLATGNDFRAIEACGHAYAARDGQYRSLSHCSLDNDVFRFWLDIPLALGTIGGLTKAHPLAASSLEILGKPSAEQLMRITAATGLAQNFAAVRSLVTTGIQAGHMRMHLQNILTQLGADQSVRQAATDYFSDKTVSVAGVRAWLSEKSLSTS